MSSMKTLDLSILIASSLERVSTRSDKVALRDISVKLVKCKKVVVVNGAGISCSSGIPDFRSETGLYSLVKSRYPTALLSGRDLFSASSLSNPTTRPIFYTFISELSKACRGAQPTATHRFLKKMNDKGRLMRVYTQNVDGLERRVGLNAQAGTSRQSKGKGKEKVVELHGDLEKVRCGLCSGSYDMKQEWERMFGNGEAPGCPACLDRYASRMARSARPIAIGTLRPSIVLYDEPHPSGDSIASILSADIARQPDMLLIMGTSLKVHGLRSLVKDLAKSVHEKGGIVVFVNLTHPGKEWEGVVDTWIKGTTDEWVARAEADWRKVKPGEWEVQGKLDVIGLEQRLERAEKDTVKRIPLQSSGSWENTLSPRSSPRHKRPLTPPETPEVSTPSPRKRKKIIVESEDEEDEGMTPSKRRVRI